MTTVHYSDSLFAALDRDHTLVRIAGGNETEVYRSDCGRFVVKVKGDLAGDVETALQWAIRLRAAADRFRASLGPEYSIPTGYLVARDNQGHAQVVAVQPFMADAIPLHDVDFATLSRDERLAIAAQLREIIRRALSFFRRSGSMPDLYGRSSTSSAARRHNNALSMLPRRIWSFLVERNLLRSHNLLLLRDPTPRIILVDYDPVRQGWLYQRVYYAVRWLLFLRDHALIAML